MGINFSVDAQEAQEDHGHLIVAPTIPDPALYRGAFAEYEMAVNALKAEAESLTIADDAGRDFASELGTRAQKILKALEAKRDELIREPNDFVKSIRNFCATYTKPLEDVKKIAGRKISDYAYQQEMKRREAERKMQQEAEKLQKKMDKQAEKKGIEPVTLPTPVLPKTETKVRTDSGASYQKSVWKFEITDEAKVPREYLAVNETKIREAVKMGIREIAGVRIFETFETAFRR